VARPASPEFAARVATGISEEERQALAQIARQRRVKVAAVIRWAVEEYLANHATVVPARRQARVAS
jgi:hypothetical protein